MSLKLLAAVEASSLKSEVPSFEIGDTVDVHTRILEGEKERVQIFNGVVIAKSGTGSREMFTVRRIVAGEGVDPAQLAARFSREIEKETANVAKLEAKLVNENFTANAPGEVILAEREKLVEMQRRIVKLGSYVKDLQ